jgi:hypothetical protein
MAVGKFSINFLILGVLLILSGAEGLHVKVDILISI